MLAYKDNPYDPMLCLTLAVAYVGRSMQRQSDNRHHQIIQGLAFLSRYRNIKGRGSPHAEVEYNFGRYFHQLGILHLAVKHYRQVLQISEQNERDSVTIPLREAAYNLALIYSTTGAARLARAIYLRWLSI